MTDMSREDVRERLGNIDQIRDIIFGAQLRDYDNRFSKIESNVSVFQQEMRSHIEQLKVYLSAELKTAIEGMDKKYKSLSLTTQEDAIDLRQQLDRLNRKCSNSIQSLDDALDSQTYSIRTELSQTKEQLQDDIMALRDLVLEELEQRFSHLREAKVSREDMAESLIALGMRLKGTEFIPKLRQAADENNDYALTFLETATLSKALTHSNGSSEVH
jgi:gas vesicle protein